MPKETFYNLPACKKQKLIDALQQEFTNYSLSQASITRIINDADIPRGSFYQYFDDKSDAYFYLFNQQIKEASDKLLELLKENNGDIFTATKHLFNLIVEDNNPFTFFPLAFLNTDYKIYNALSTIFVKEVHSDQFLRMYEILDLSHLQVKEKEQLIQLMQILSAVTFHNFKEKYSKDIPVTTAVSQYQSQLDVIKKGVSA